MTAINFILPDGSTKRIKATDGLSIMEVAVANGVDGIRAECGGALSCATCHVHVDEPFREKVGAASEMEADMLDFAETEPGPGSRLCCQIRVTQDLDGLTVQVPAA